MLLDKVALLLDHAGNLSSSQSLGSGLLLKIADFCPKLLDVLLVLLNLLLDILDCHGGVGVNLVDKTLVVGWWSASGSLKVAELVIGRVAIPVLQGASDDWSLVRCLEELATNADQVFQLGLALNYLEGEEDWSVCSDLRAAELTVSSDTAVGQVGGTVDLDLFAFLHVQHCHVPALEHVVVSLLEGQGLAVVGNLGIVHLLKEVSILDEALVVNGHVVERHALPSTLLAWSVLNELDVSEILGSLIRVVSVEVQWVLPHGVNQLELSVLPPGPEVLPGGLLSL